jgi:hypothetical protein
VPSRTLIMLWTALGVVFLAALVLATKVGGLPTKPFGLADVGKLLTTFFVLALFVERTLEVFITAWRGGPTAKAEHDIAGFTATAAAAATAAVAAGAVPNTQAQQAAQIVAQDATQKANAKANWLVDYKSETQRIALRAGLVLGIVVAAIGVRAFGTFVQLPPVAADGVPAWRNGILNVIDVLISGGIIGGGSEAIHKLMTVITGFFEQTAANLKKPVI